jgi:hypothetical protein
MGKQGQQSGSNRGNQQGQRGGNMPNRGGQQGQNEKISSDRNTLSPDDDMDREDSERSRSSNRGMSEENGE